MKSIILKSVFLMAVASGVLSGCANSDDYDTPPTAVTNCVDPGLSATKTVREVIAMANATPTEYTADDIIEGYVTSSDEKGTFYKSISFQTLDAVPDGFSVPVNITSAFAERFVPGTKVYIKLKGLYIAMVYGSLQIGQLYQSSPTAPVEIGRISENDYKSFLFPSCADVPEDNLVRTLTLAEAYKDSNLNTLIDLEGVRFVDAALGKTYFDASNQIGGATNHYIVPVAGGTSRIIRFSSFAPFSGNAVPSGSGKIRGVLTKYQSDYQFIVRYESDIMLTTPRTLNFSGSFTEDFQNYASAQDNFPNYINDPVIGNKVWNIKTSATNFIEMTSFNSNEKNRTLFFVPVDFTAANTLTFQYKVSFLVTGHVPLKVYYTKNYTPGQHIDSVALTNITSGFSGLAAQTATTFATAGTYNFPAGLTGNGFIVFEYTGSGVAPLQTTNLGIDNIVVN